MIFSGNNDSLGNFSAQNITFQWTHLDEGILFCGKFNVGTVPGISVVLVASKKILQESVNNKVTKKNTYCQIANKIRCNSSAQEVVGVK